MSAVTHRDHEPVTDALAVMLGDDHDGPLSVFAVGPDGRRTVRWARTNVEVAAIATTLTDHDVWVGLATRAAQLGSGQRGGVADCLSIASLWADLDVVGPNHARADICPTMADARRFVDTATPLGPPALVIETGGGLHAYWPLAERVEGADAIDLLAQWGAYLAGRAKALGWHLDNVYDLARVMRVPGTSNHKGDTPVPVVVVRMAETPHHSDFDWLPDPTPAQRTLSAPAVPYVGPQRPGDAFNLAHACGDVLAACGWEHAETTRNGDQMWRRPGKRSGHSAQVYAADGRCRVWTDAVQGLEQRASYDAFGLYARLRHDGDIRSATSALGDLGYGERGDLDLSVLRVAAGPVPVDAGEDPTPEGDDAEWPEPEPIVMPDLAPAPLPSRFVFGDMIADVIEEIAEQVQVPQCAVAQLVIGAFSVIACGRVNVRITDDWAEPAHLQQAVVLPSGRAKSPTEAAVMNPVREAEARRREVTADDLARKRHERAVATKRVKELSQLGSDNLNDPEIQLEMAKCDRILDLPPPEPFRLTVQDTTPERFVQLLWSHDGRLSIVSPEPEILATALGAQTGRSSNVSLEVFLKGQDGGWHDVERKGGRETGPTSIRLSRVCVAIMVCAQPGIFERARTDETLVDRGFAARLMTVAPPVERIDAHRRLMAKSTGARARWADLVATLADRWWAYGTAVDLRLTEEAGQMHARWAQPIYDRWNDGDLERLGGFIAKLTSNVARVAALLHMAAGGSASEPVGTEQMRRACAVGDWWLAHALWLWTKPDAQLDPDERMALRIAEWVRERDLDGYTQREAHRMLLSSAFGRRLDADDTSAAIDVGHKRGWWRAEAPVRNTTRRVVVNPALFTCGDLVSRMSRVALPRGKNENTPTTPFDTHPPSMHATRDTRDNPQDEVVDVVGAEPDVLSTLGDGW